MNADAPQPTVREIVAQYLHFAGPDLAKRSLDLTRRYLDRFIAAFGDRSAEGVARRELIHWLRSQDQWRANATKRSALTRIKACMNWAVKEELLERHHFTGVSWEDSGPRRSMTDEEFRTAWRHASRVFRQVLWFLRATGCRPGELARLEWPMIDWGRRVAVLAEHKTMRKTGAPRILYLSPLAIRFLRVLERRRIPEMGEHVFFSTRGTRWTDVQLSYHWRRAARDGNLPPDCLLYGIRHGFATRCAMKNGIETTAKLLGHANIRTTAHYYIHLDEHRDFLVNAAARVNERSPK